MGSLSCQRCGATADGDTQEQADSLIDHSLGQKIGRACEGKDSDLVWSGTTKAKTQPQKTVVEDSHEKPKRKSKRSE